MVRELSMGATLENILTRFIAQLKCWRGFLLIEDTDVAVVCLALSLTLIVDDDLLPYFTLRSTQPLSSTC